MSIFGLSRKSAAHTDGSPLKACRSDQKGSPAPGKGEDPGPELTAREPQESGRWFARAGERHGVAVMILGSACQTLSSSLSPEVPDSLASDMHDR